MEELKSLQGLGLDLPSPAYIAGSILFGLLGWAAFRHGRKHGRKLTTGLGLALMLYPYLISQTWALWAVGLALCAGVALDRG